MLGWKAVTPPKEKKASQYCLENPQAECPSPLLPVHLSIHSPDFLSHSTFFFPYVHFLSTGCLPCLLIYDWLYLIMFTIFKQEALGLKYILVNSTIWGFTVCSNILQLVTVHVWLCKYACVNVCMFVCESMCACMHVYACMYACMYIDVCVCSCVYKHTHATMYMWKSEDNSHESVLFCHLVVSQD